MRGTDRTTRIALAGTAGLALAMGVAYLSTRALASPAPAAETVAGPGDQGRAGLRAFYTAPPVIPHEVTSRGNKECLHCHSDVRRIGERTTVMSPHLGMQNCQQCHVGPQMLNRDYTPGPVATTWRGLEEPTQGTRAHAYAPPTVPHRYFMRENCAACHSENHVQEEMRSPHTERTRCLQCHAMDFDREF